LSRAFLNRVSVAAALLALPAAASAETVVSSGPDAVSVTVYRDPGRRGGGTLDLRWLAGFALVTETRTVAIPAGTSDIRFEGVAEGIVPVSAIVTGLPGGVVQKNRDARLLSPAALVDGTLGRRVTVRRTDPATGRVVEEPAVIRAGPSQGVVLETKAGFEALGCSGLPEKLIYDQVPPGLSPRPTLSVTTRSPAAATVKVSLSYLASGFDWNASYVARVAPDGRTLDLFAWLTLANGNGESFAAAETQAVAGTLNRTGDDGPQDDGPDPQLRLQCWPMDSTRSAPESMVPLPPPPPPAPPMAAPQMAEGADVVVTAARFQAVQEELGDLKLYRVPERVTIAANAQKQVALVQKTGIPFERLHTVTVLAELGEGDSWPTAILLRTKNVVARQLGVPLPSGGVALFEQASGRDILVGEGQMRDTAIGEDVEIAAGTSEQVRIAVTDPGGDPRERLMTLTNANPFPVTVEVLLRTRPDRPVERPSVRLGKKNGIGMWVAQVPAHGSSALRYRLKPDD
jgi:hypothetical protein